MGQSSIADKGPRPRQRRKTTVDPGGIDYLDVAERGHQTEPGQRGICLAKQPVDPRRQRAERHLRASLQRRPGVVEPDQLESIQHMYLVHEPGAERMHAHRPLARRQPVGFFAHFRLDAAPFDPAQADLWELVETPQRWQGNAE